MNFIGVLFLFNFISYVSSAGLLKNGEKPIMTIEREDQVQTKVRNNIIIRKRVQPAPMINHGGGIIKNANVYTIYYGDWQTPSMKASIKLITHFFNNIHKTDAWNVQKQYIGESTVIERKIIFDNYSLGKNAPDVQQIIKNAINSGKLPIDSNGIYYVITSKDVVITDFCKSFCGYHSYFPFNSNNTITNIVYSFVGDSTTCWGCSPIRNSINNNLVADTSMSIIFHELVESMSDPYLNTWFDTEGYENADKCSWNYGKTYLFKNKPYNLKTNTHKFLIQGNFDMVKNSCSTGFKMPVIKKKL